MEPTTTPAILPIPPAAGLWKSWRVYLVRWLIFGAAAGLLQPVVSNLEQFWEQKLYQMLSGLPFGLACAVVFTLAQNKLNALRTRGRSWAILLATWMGMKFVFVGIMLAFS
jgi:hypothetical protein